MNFSKRTPHNVKDWVIEGHFVPMDSPQKPQTMYTQARKRGTPFLTVAALWLLWFVFIQIGMLIFGQICITIGKLTLGFIYLTVYSVPKKLILGGKS